jgi:hypothetical protein
MHRSAADVTALQLDLAGVYRGPKLETDAKRRPTDFLSGMDGSLSAVEQGHKSIASRRDLAAPKAIEHRSHRLVVPGQQVAPPAVA